MSDDSTRWGAPAYPNDPRHQGGAPQWDPYGAGGQQQPPYGAGGQYPPPWQPGAPPYGHPSPDQPAAPKRWWQKRSGRLLVIAVAAMVGVAIAVVILPAYRDDCGSDQIRHSLADSDVPSGYTAVRDPKGFAVAVPKTFVGFELDQAGLDAAAKKFGTDPARAAIFAQAKTVLQNNGVLFRANPVSGETIVVTRISQRGLGCEVPDDAMPQLRTALDQAGFTGITTHGTTVAGRKGQVLVAEVPRDMAPGGASETELVLPGKDVAYAVAITHASLPQADVDRIVASFRIT